MLTLLMKPEWVRYKLEETIESLVVISWPHTKGSVNMLDPHSKNGDASHLEISDEITTRGKCVPPL
jgi:hypothetical protein